MAISKELQTKLDYYEQIYYALDEPVPFKENLKCYPVLVKDYYNFYSCYGCITMDKTVKTVSDEMGRPKKISNPKGIGQSYLEFLIDQMKDKEVGPYITNQVMGLFSLVFHIKKGMYCPKCGKILGYDELFEGMNDYVNQTISEAEKIYAEAQKPKEEKPTEEAGEGQKEHKLPDDLVSKITQKARLEFLTQATECPDCGESMKDTFSIKEQNGMSSFVVLGTEITSSEFDEFKALVPRQNILDFDDDKYIDPELKEELELKARLQNKDYTSPTLEKQLICVGISTGYTLEYLKTITMRKLSMMLRLVDRKQTYYAQLQASMSGLVTFKKDPEHWIFSDDKKNIREELTSLDDFEKKFAHVV